MNTFELYFRLGLDHITDLGGYDHMLYLLALITAVSIRDWKKLLIVITAFTVGHSITLALVSLEVLTVSSAWVEFLIPVTIFLTAIVGMLTKSTNVKGVYVLTVLFGLIHGMGFSGYFRSILMNDESIALPLLYFNIGVEVGQIIFVLIAVLAIVLITRMAGVREQIWKTFVSGGIIALSIQMIFENKIW